MSRVIEIDVEELWNNTYSSGASRQLGELHLATARMLLENPDTPPKKLPLYKYMMTQPPQRKKPSHAVIAYLNKYKRVLELIKARGYDSRLGLIPVRRTVSDRFGYHHPEPAGTITLKDGNRRLTAILVIGKQKQIKVELY